MKALVRSAMILNSIIHCFSLHIFALISHAVQVMSQRKAHNYCTDPEK